MERAHSVSGKISDEQNATRDASRWPTRTIASESTSLLNKVDEIGVTFSKRRYELKMGLYHGIVLVLGFRVIMYFTMSISIARV